MLISICILYQQAAAIASPKKEKGKRPASAKNSDEKLTSVKSIGDKVIEADRAMQGKSDPGPVVTTQIKKLRATRSIMEKWKINNVSKSGKAKPVPDPQPPDGKFSRARHHRCRHCSSLSTIPGNPVKILKYVSGLAQNEHFKVPRGTLTASKRIPYIQTLRRRHCGLNPNPVLADCSDRTRSHPGGGLRL